jgi:hypothetical protein
VRALAGIVFQQVPTPEGIPTEIQALYDDDIDNQGTSGDTFLRHTFEDALTTGLAGIFVDQAALDNLNATRADELAAGIRPFWTLICMDNIVSFRTVQENGVTLLAQLVFRETVQVPWGAFGVQQIERLRVYRRTPSTGEVSAFVLWEIWTRGENGKWALTDTGELKGVTEIPLAQIYTGRTGFMDAKPPLLDLANENLLHYQTRSDMHHAAHIANVPVLFGTGIDADQIQVGPNRAILVKGAKPDEASLRWLETLGSGIGSTRAILGDIDEYMANLGLGMLQRKSAAAQTAQKASLDRKEQDATLVAIVGDLENGIEQALYWTAQFMGLKDGGRLTFSRDFQLDPAATSQTENQGASADPKAPKQPGETNNPATSS